MLLLKVKSEKTKAEYQEIFFNIAEMDLIASQFKLHKECWKMLTRPIRVQTNTDRGNPIGNFDKLVSHIDFHLMDLDYALDMGTAVRLYYGSDTDEASGESMTKRR